MSDFGRMLLPLSLLAVPNEKNTIAAAKTGNRNNLLSIIFGLMGVIFKQFSYNIFLSLGLLVQE
jgi:hypothetical protein